MLILVLRQPEDYFEGNRHLVDSRIAFVSGDFRMTGEERQPDGAKRFPAPRQGLGKQQLNPLDRWPRALSSQPSAAVREARRP